MTEKSQLMSVAGVLLLTTVFFVFQPSYIPTALTSWLGIVLLPFVTRPSTHKGGRWIYLILIVVFFALQILGQSATGYYLLFVGLVLLWLDMTRYRLNYLPLLLLLVLAPIVRNVVFTWSFPIRIKMSEWVGEVLKIIGKDVLVSGNILVMDGTEFSVDPACTGLKMMSIAMVLGLFIFAHYERTLKKTLGIIPAVAGLVLILALTVFANFSRLLALVLFHVLPEHFLHSGIGILSLSIYVLLPMFFLSERYVQHCGKSDEVETIFPFFKIKNHIALLGLLLLPLVWIGLQKQTISDTKDSNLESIELEGFEKSITKNNITKFVQEDVLIYLKPPVSAFGSAHDPRYCWQGSGYEFKHIHPVTIANIDVYWATLVRDKNEVVTAWWYENGSHRTISEWEWRWQSLSGHRPYRLVNISARNEAALRVNVERFLLQNQLQ